MGEEGIKKQVNIRIDEDRKAEWESYLKESGEHKTLTGLIRFAVEREVNGNQERKTSDSPALASDLQELKSDVERIRKDVRWLRKQREDEVDISEVAQRVQQELEALPQPSEPSKVPEGVDIGEDQFRREEAARTFIMPDGEKGSPNTQRVEDLADRVGAPPGDVREAIEHLQDQLLPIVEVELNGETHYFMEE